MTEKRFTITQDFEEHHRQIRDNGKIIMGCFVEPQAEAIVNLLNALNDENEQLKNMVEHNYVEHKRCVNNYVDKIKEVEKENEQLKNEIKDLNDVLARYEEKFIKPVCKNGFDVDVNCTNGFTIITNKTELKEWINEQELEK